MRETLLHVQISGRYVRGRELLRISKDCIESFHSRRRTIGAMTVTRITTRSRTENLICQWTEQSQPHCPTPTRRATRRKNNPDSNRHSCIQLSHCPPRRLLCCFPVQPAFERETKGLFRAPPRTRARTLQLHTQKRRL